MSRLFVLPPPQAEFGGFFFPARQPPPPFFPTFLGYIAAISIVFPWSQTRPPLSRPQAFTKTGTGFLAVRGLDGFFFFPPYADPFFFSSPPKRATVSHSFPFPPGLMSFPQYILFVGFFPCLPPIITVLSDSPSSHAFTLRFWSYRLFLFFSVISLLCLGLSWQHSFPADFVDFVPSKPILPFCMHFCFIGPQWASLLSRATCLLFPTLSYSASI